MVEIKRPAAAVSGEIDLPSSKSVSNRLLILRQQYSGLLTIKNLSTAEDTVLLEKALSEYKTTTNIHVKDAGTDMRFLTAFLSAQEGNWMLTGSERLQQRPVADLVDALRQLGAEIQYTMKEGFPPLQIKGKKLKGNGVQVRADKSSQFVSALLLIAPFLENGLRIKCPGKKTSEPYIKMTLALLKQLGVTVKETDDTYDISPLSVSGHVDFTVEPDWSAASYYYSICALSPGSKILLKGLSLMSLQGDAVLARIYNELGVQTTEDVRGLTLENTRVSQGIFKYNFSDCPDIAQTVAVTCLGLKKEALLTGLETLKIKETDRISALETELRKIGAGVIASSGTLHLKHTQIEYSESPTIKTYNDHRMAMSFAPLALKMNKIIIQNPEVTAKSYPAFWHDLRSLGFSVNLQPR